MKRHLSVCVGMKHDGWGLVDYLAHRFTYQTREKWEHDVKEGLLVVNRKPSFSLQTVLSVGDIIVYKMPHRAEPPVEKNFSILYEDDDLLVVDKPGGLPCHPGGRYFRHTLWALISDGLGIDNLSLVNRLDRETSGVVLIAKNKKAARHCNRQFAERKVLKRYQVLVEGCFSPGEQNAVGYLDMDPASAIRKKRRFYQLDAEESLPSDMKQCNTFFSRQKVANGLSLLEAVPRTGRHHQIRASLYSLGFPVVGDKMYGVDENFFLRFIEDKLTQTDKEKLRMDRQALHASSLAILHPANGQRLQFSAPLPEEFKLLLR